MPATIQDIGRALNLSHTTVSRVLNGRKDQFISDATRRRVLDAAQKMGYRPHRVARALATGRTHQIAVWMRNMSSAYDAQVMRHLLLQMHQDRYQAVIGVADLLADADAYSTEPGVAAALSETFWSVDGCLAFESMPHLIPLLGREAQQHLPLVGLGGAHFSAPELPGMDYVGVDLRAGAEAALRHLLQIGCRRIAFVGASGADDDNEPRQATYRAVLAEAGRPPEIIVTEHHTRAIARSAMQQYIAAHGSPDGLFCFNDDVALGAYRAVRDRGLRVPEDVALIGHDGIEDAEYLDCPLTTLAQPVEQMTALAWSYLRQRIDDPALPPQQTLLKAQLVLRASTQR
jgi:LacI family transcriptional regulator